MEASENRFLFVGLRISESSLTSRKLWFSDLVSLEKINFYKPPYNKLLTSFDD